MCTVLVRAPCFLLIGLLISSSPSQAGTDGNREGKCFGHVALWVELGPEPRACACRPVWRWSPCCALYAVHFSVPLSSPRCCGQPLVCLTYRTSVKVLRPASWFAPKARAEIFIETLGHLRLTCPFNPERISKGGDPHRQEGALPALTTWQQVGS